MSAVCVWLIEILLDMGPLVQCLVQFYLNGGQVTSWKNAQGEELLFMSKKVNFSWQMWEIGIIQTILNVHSFLQANFKPPITIRGGIPMGILEVS